ncbi:MAG: DUF2723 domain-containing protein [Phycisphaerae bacterium]|nr:DUF2723 domain-containing protein [Phycisphaerae bacterium]
MATTIGQRGHQPLAEQGAGRSTFPTLAGWLLVFLASLCLYATTANRGPQWQDSGEFILRITTGDLLGRLGLALSHPLHYWLGRAAIAPGLLEPAFAITLISSLGAALAVATVFGCVRTLSGSTASAFFAAASLALANTFWHLGTIAEVYTLSAALLAGECWCLAVYAKRGSRWAIWGMCLFSGLGLANHLQALLTLPVLALVILHGMSSRRLRIGDLLIAMWLWLLGSLPYTGLVLGLMVHGAEPMKTLQSALFGNHFSVAVLNASATTRMIMTDIAFPLLNFPNLLIPAALYGLVRYRRAGMPGLAWLAMTAGLVIHAVFALRYEVLDQHTFFLPMYTFLAIFGGVGAAAVLRWPATLRRESLCAAAILLLLATPLLNIVAIITARRVQLLGQFAHRKPYRDDYIYLLVPWSVVDRSAERMSSEAVSLASPDGLVLVEDGMARSAVEYRRLQAGLTGVGIRMVPSVERQEAMKELAAEVRSEAEAGRAVVLVPLNRDQPRLAPPLGRWQRRGDLYVLDASASKQSATETAQ